jgi:hypothetical protein
LSAKDNLWTSMTNPMIISKDLRRERYPNVEQAKLNHVETIWTSACIWIGDMSYGSQNLRHIPQERRVYEWNLSREFHSRCIVHSPRLSTW